MFLYGLEAAVKLERKILSMIVDCKLNFQWHMRQAVMKARRGTGIIPYLLKYVSRGVLEEIYKLYMGPQLYYDDIIYHKYDAEFKVESTKKLESMW